MNEITDPAPKVKYRWPWFLLAAVIVGIALYVVWMGLEIRHVEQERNVDAPLPSQTPIR